MAKLIGLTGLAHCGKDTAADILCAEFGYTKLAFADPLKKAVASIANEPVSNFYDNNLKEMPCPVTGRTRRVTMQAVGEGLRHILGQNIWLANMACRLQTSPVGVVISDVRYDNEAKFILGHGGVVIKIHRESAGLHGAVGNHSSEQGISDHLVYATVTNNGTVESLREALLLLLKTESKA